MKTISKVFALTATVVCTISIGFFLTNKAEKSNSLPRPLAITMVSEVKIGSQYWTKENLSVTKFKDGTTIPQAKTAAEWEAFGKSKKAAWCYPEFKQSNDNLYGKQYNWYAVSSSKGLAPSGYHIPTKAEWEKLINYLRTTAPAGNEGLKIKNAQSWPGEGATNSSGFTARPGGSIGREGNFTPGFNIGKRARFWTATQAPNSSFAYYADLSAKNSSGSTIFKNIVISDGANKEWGMSIRCIKN